MRSSPEVTALLSAEEMIVNTVDAEKVLDVVEDFKFSSLS
jgi:hypothetical protein